LRWAGFSVDYSLTPAKPDKQFKRAIESKAARTAKLERAEDGTLRARIKDLATREEKVLAASEVAEMLGK